MHYSKNKTPRGVLFFEGAEAAQAELLARAGFDIAIAALAHHNGRDICLLYPMTVLLEGLSWPLCLHIFALVALRCVGCVVRSWFHKEFTESGLLNKRECDALFACAAGAADTVHVVLLRRWELVVDNVAHI